MNPTPSGGFTSALLDDLNLELDIEGRVISVWGLCPHTRWKEADLMPPDAEFGELFVVPSVPLKAGVSVPINDKKYWPVLVDPSSGWVRVTSEATATATAAVGTTSLVKIMPGVIVQITEEGKLAGLWLRPERLPNGR